MYVLLLLKMASSDPKMFLMKNDRFDAQKHSHELPDAKINYKYAF